MTSAPGQAKYRLDAWSNKKARVKLIAAASKAKMDLSPFGVNHSSVSVECLMEDRDFSTKLVCVWVWLAWLACAWLCVCA